MGNDDLQWVSGWSFTITPWDDYTIYIPLKKPFIPARIPEPWPSHDRPFEIVSGDDPRPVPWITDLQALADADATVKNVLDDNTRSAVRNSLREAAEKLINENFSHARLVIRD